MYLPKAVEAIALARRGPEKIKHPRRPPSIPTVTKAIALNIRDSNITSGNCKKEITVGITSYKGKLTMLGPLCLMLE